MKKILSIIIILFLFSIKNVSAIDNVYSLNKYSSENLDIILRGYKEDNKKDGWLVGGNIINKEDKSQLIIIKYKKNGEILWKYTKSTTEDNYLISVDYSYYENKVDGYLLFIQVVGHSNIIKLDLSGTFQWEKELDNYYEKLLVITNTNQEIEKYLLIGQIEQKGIIDTYNNNLERINRGEYSSSVKDVVELESNKYAAIIEKDNSEEKETNLLILDQDNIIEINNTLNRYTNYYLLKTSEGFILYGITPEVKLKKGEESYYIIKYNQEGTIEWESIGSIPINSSKKIKLTYDSEQYYLLYENEDLSKEVITLSLDGVYNEKIKKINNNYYTFNNLLIDGKTIYFVGQIQCSEEDDCQNEARSLFLVSDEEKVIEVEDNASTSILLVIGIIGVIIISIWYIRRKRKK